MENEFVKKLEEILRTEQDTAYAYKDIYDNYIKKFGPDLFSKKLNAIYNVELEHISLV